MTIRPATAADLAGISLIQRAAPEASQWDTLSYLDYACMVAADGETEAGETVLGFLVFRETGPGEHEILNLAVHPDARRRGVARQLLKAVLAPSRGKWFLEVRAANIGAIQLYENLGFRQVARREGYYHNPSESGIVMRFDS
jgi:ribosomal-protein-alanine N-acetyltransferase